MLAVFTPQETTLKRSEPTDLTALPLDTVWIDLLNPSPGEDHAVERLFGIAVPTREEMQEIEESSRLYTEKGALYMTAWVPVGLDTPDQDTPRGRKILPSESGSGRVRLRLGDLLPLRRGTGLPTRGRERRICFCTLVRVAHAPHSATPA